MTGLIDTVAPPRLAAGFRWLLGSSWTSNLGDGFGLAAGPLLVASQTNNAFVISLAALVQWLPPLLFGLYAGALSDRLDRRLMVVAVDGARAVVLAVIAVSIVTGSVSIVVVLVALFLLGTAEVFADNASQTLLPMLVRRDDLAVANARIQAGFVTVNQLVGPPLGAALFAVGMAWPFVGQAVLVATGAILMSRVALPAHGDARRPVAGINHEIAEGVRWVRHHAAVRTLVLTIFTFNITFGAAWSVLVLYASERLGLGAIGFGLITTVSALGGLVGTLSYGWITRRVSLGNIMRIGLIIETLTHLALAITTVPAVAMGIFFVFGGHAFVWGTTSVTVRQRAVPSELQGRVGSVNTVATFGGLVAGSALGGLLAQRFGVTAPFWFAFVGSAVFLVLIWRQLAHIAHDDAPPQMSERTAGEPGRGQANEVNTDPDRGPARVAGRRKEDCVNARELIAKVEAAIKTAPGGDRAPVRILASYGDRAVEADVQAVDDETDPERGAGVRRRRHGGACGSQSVASATAVLLGLVRLADVPE